MYNYHSSLKTHLICKSTLIFFEVVCRYYHLHGCGQLQKYYFCALLHTHITKSSIFGIFVDRAASSAIKSFSREMSLINIILKSWRYIFIFSCFYNSYLHINRHRRRRCRHCIIIQFFLMYGSDNVLIQSPFSLIPNHLLDFEEKTTLYLYF